MDYQAILQELLDILARSGASIRTEPMGGGGGGLCKLKDAQIFFVDTQAPESEMAAIAARAVSRLIDTETTYIKPQTRQFIEKNNT